MYHEYLTKNKDKCGSDNLKIQWEIYRHTNKFLMSSLPSLLITKGKQNTTTIVTLLNATHRLPYYKLDKK